MDFSLTEAERDLVGLCRDFAHHQIAPRAPAAWEEGRCPTDLLREVPAQGDQVALGLGQREVHA